MCPCKELYSNDKCVYCSFHCQQSIVVLFHGSTSSSRTASLLQPATFRCLLGAYSTVDIGLTQSRGFLCIILLLSGTYLILSIAHTWASLIKSAASSSEATMTIPTPPRNKRAFALKTTNLIKLLSFPMVAWHVHSHTCWSPSKTSQPPRLSPWLPHLGRGAAVVLCFYRWWCWLLCSWHPVSPIPGFTAKSRKKLFSRRAPSPKLE